MGQRAGPTSADLQVLPPAERIVGEPATATVAITPARAVAAATVSVAGSSGLEVVGAERGVIYRGSLAGGERTDLSVRIIARRAGTHQLTVNVKSSDGALSTGVVARIPGFALPAPAEQRRVKLSFTGTPVREAIQKIAAASGLRVVVREEVGTETVTKDFSAGVPAQAALVVVAEACGYRVREDNGSYVVEKP